MCDFVYKYEEHLNKSMDDKIIVNLEETKDIMIAVMGLCRGDLSQLEIIGNKVGFFEKSKMNEFIIVVKKISPLIFHTDGPPIKGMLGMAKILGDSIMWPEVLFTTFDRDQSGSIDINEFTELCKCMGLFLSKDVIHKLFAAADKDGSN